MPIVELLCPLDSNSPAGSAVTEWVRALAWTGDMTVLGRVRIPLRKTFSFGTLAIPFAPLCQSPLTLKLPRSASTRRKTLPRRPAPKKKKRHDGPWRTTPGCDKRVPQGQLFHSQVQKILLGIGRWSGTWAEYCGRQGRWRCHWLDRILYSTSMMDGGWFRSESPVRCIWIYTW